MSKLRDFAKGQQCSMRLPGCLLGTETVVLAHLPSLSGMGRKSEDWFAVHACMNCHDIIDGRRYCDLYPSVDSVNAQLPHALHETLARAIAAGLIHIDEPRPKPYRKPSKRMIGA